MRASTGKEVIKVLNKTPNLKAGEICKALGMQGMGIDKVYRALSYLVKTKKLSRRGGRYTIAYGLPMTAIAPDAKPDPQPVIQAMRKTETENKRLHEEAETLKDQLQDISVKYYDALAVINYLEKFIGVKK